MNLPILAQPFRLLTISFLCFWLAIAAFPAAAQNQAATTEATTDTQQALGQLVEVLRDDAAREALIAELEANLPAEGTEAAAEEAAPSPSDDVRSLGSRIADFTGGAVEGAVQSLSLLWHQLANVPSLFAGLNLTELDALAGIAGHIAILVLVTYGGLFIVRRIAAGPRARLRHLFQSGGWIAKPVALILDLALDIVAALVPYALGYLVAVTFLGELGRLGLEHTLYLNAFLMIEIALSVLRAVVSPGEPEQRLLHISDRGASAVMGWSRLLVSLFVYGQMMVLPLVTATISFSAGRAISVVLLVITLLVAALAVLAARQPVRQKMLNLIADRETRRGLRLPIEHWHVFALIYLGVLAIIALTRSSAQFQAYLWANAQIGIAVLVGFIVLNIIRRIGASGVKLPESMRRRSPELQRQLNAIVPVVLKVVRIIVIAVVVIVCLHGLGFFNFVDFLESEFGARVTGSVVTILMILAVAIIAWIALNAWVDGQVNPELAPAATARRRTLFTLMRSALTITIIVITLMFVLSEVGINIAPLIASAGVIGLAIGFGAQKLVQDIITGIFIQIEGAMDVGDSVSIGGISGTVERLTIRSASLRDVEGSYHIIPFSSVDVVTNFMRGFSYALIDMSVGYSENLEDAKKAMLDAFEQLRADPEYTKAIIADFEWMGINAFGASDVVLRARIKTLPGKQWATKRAYSAVVKRIFDERGIEIPYPHQTLYFGVDKDGKAPPLHMVRDKETNGHSTPAAEAGVKTLEAKAKPKPRRRRKGEIAGKDMPDKDAGPDVEEN